MSLHQDWEALRGAYRQIAVAGLERSVTPDQRHYAHNVDFVEQRFQEGVELASYFPTKFGERPLTILDAGAGSGGVSIALANLSHHRVIAIDVVFNEDLHRLRHQTRIPVAQILASADQLPFRDGVFDSVLCLETIEHLPDAGSSGREMMRVTKSGGQVMITTPARLRYLWRPDPHYQVKGLMLLPDSMQRRVVVDRLRLTRTYDVQHIFWSAPGVVTNFPGRRKVETLVAIPWPGRPRNLRELLWKLFRSLLWDRIVIWK